MLIPVPRVLVIMALCIALSACASSGRQMEAQSLSQIQVGQTTKDDMLAMFGTPMSQTLDTNGKLVMMWHYVKAQSYVVTTDVKQQMLSVLFDENGVVERYSLIDNVNS